MIALTEISYSFEITADDMDALKKRAREVADEVLGEGSRITSFHSRENVFPGKKLRADVTAEKMEAL